MAGGAGVCDGLVVGDGDLRGVERRLREWLAVVRAIVNDDGSIIIVRILCRSCLRTESGLNRGGGRFVSRISIDWA
jgi:hypothetical protein